jgi:hypothetical protein
VFREEISKMKNGKGPKCGSATVYSLTNGLVPGGRNREYVQFGGFYFPVDVLSFVCTTCGYYDNYVADQKKLSEVMEK